MCLSEEEIPKALFPKIKSAGIMSPINGPLTYQGQGCVSIFIVFCFYLFNVSSFDLAIDLLFFFLKSAIGSKGPYLCCCSEKLSAYGPNGWSTGFPSIFGQSLLRSFFG